MKRKLISLATKLGCMITRSFNDNTIFIDAPRHYVFKASNTHVLLCEDWSDAHERLSYGLEKCEDEDCESCESNHTFQQVHEINQQELIYMPNLLTSQI